MADLEGCKRRRFVAEDSSFNLDTALSTAVDTGARPASDPLPAAVKLLQDTLKEIMGAERWNDFFDASSPGTQERCTALDAILDMPAAYEVLGADLGAMQQHIFELTEKLLVAHAQEKGFTFDDAIRHHATYNVQAMCGVIASTRNRHLGSTLAVDPLCARAPYTAASMFLLPMPCTLTDKVVYERPMPIGGSNTRKSKLHDRTRKLFTHSLKKKLFDKGLLYKNVERSGGGQPAGAKGKASTGKADKRGKAAGMKGVGKAKAKAGGKGKGGKGGLKGDGGDGHDQGGKGADADVAQEYDAATDADDADDADDGRSVTKSIVADQELAWLFVNARVTFEGLIDNANEQAVSTELGLGPRIFYATEEGSLTMALPGQSAKSGALSFEEFILFSDGNIGGFSAWWNPRSACRVPSLAG